MEPNSKMAGARRIGVVLVCVCGLTTSLAFTTCYIALWFTNSGSRARDVSETLMCVLLAIAVMLLVPFKWRARSSDPNVFFGGGLRSAKGPLWKVLRGCLWISFLVALLHVSILLQLDSAARRTSRHSMLMCAAAGFYFACLSSFMGLYGVHSVAVCRRAWEFFYGTRQMSLSRGNVSGRVQCAAANGAPATRPGNSVVTKGPPSVS